MMLNFTHTKKKSFELQISYNRSNAVTSRIDKTVIEGLPRVTALVIQKQKNKKQPKTWGL